MSYSLRALVATGLAAACALLPGTALAGTYSVTQTLNADTTGWAYSGNPGFTGCSKTLVTGACSGLTAPSPLYIIGSGAATAGTGARWVWTAPQGLSVSSGSIMPYWSIAAKGTTAYLQTATAGQTLTSQPHQFEAAGASSPTWAIPSGTTQLAVALSTSSAVTYPSALSNTVKVSKLQAVLSDTTAPTVSGSVVGVPSSGAFAASTTQVCLNLTAGDVGSGVTNLSVKNAAGTVLASFTPTAQSAFQPGAASVSNKQLCVPVSKLTQGTQTLTLSASDAGGNTTTASATVKIVSAAPPVATFAPAADSVISSRQPDIHVNVTPGSGRTIVNVSGFLDGTQPLTALLSADSTSLVWSGQTDLAVGKHTVSWTATDDAGNTSQGSYSFTIAGPNFTISGSLASNAVAKTGSGICGIVTATDTLASVKEVDVYVDGKFQSSFVGPSTPGAVTTKNVCLPSTFSDGLHSLRVRGTDSLGGTTDQTTPFSVDTAGPTVSATGTLLSSELVGSTRQCVTVTANDPNGVAKLELRDENGTAASYSNNPATSLTQDLCLAPSTLSKGTHTVDIIATDSFGVQTDQQYTISVGIPAATVTYSWIDGHLLAVAVHFDAGPYTLSHYDFSTSIPQGSPSADNGGSTANLNFTYNILGFTTVPVYWHATDSQGNTASGEYDIHLG